MSEKIKEEIEKILNEICIVNCNLAVKIPAENPKEKDIIFNGEAIEIITDKLHDLYQKHQSEAERKLEAVREYVLSKNEELLENLNLKL